jgi:hypothetical protein
LVADGASFSVMDAKIQSLKTSKFVSSSVVCIGRCCAE